MTLLTVGKNNLPFVIDDSDYEQVSKYSWYAGMKGMGRYYIYTHKKGKIIYLHRLLMNPPSDMEVDHINHISCDNRRENLRVCSHLENMSNTPFARAYREDAPPNIDMPRVAGVNYDKRHKLWKVRHHGKHIAGFKQYTDAVVCKKSLLRKEFRREEA